METTVAQKLETLLNLQSIDSNLDQIKKMRGDLPDDIRDLEDELAGIETRLGKHTGEIQQLNEEIAGRKNAIKDAEKLIKKYEEHQQNVRNNREYDAISKEIELQHLEIQISDKKIKEATARIEMKQTDVATANANLQERQKDLANKKGELDVLVAESKEEEDKLLKDREKLAKTLDERLYQSYDKLRKNVRNGLAVVMVRRDACGGCFNTVPPQRQSDIREKKKITVCEHCGRVLADVEMPVLVEAGKK